MAQSVTLHPSPVGLESELELDPENDHYYGFDQSSASALTSQHSDTLGASASDPPSDLGPPPPPSGSGSGSVSGFAALKSSSFVGHQQDYYHQHHQQQDYEYETDSDSLRHHDQPEHEPEQQQPHSHQALVSPPSSSTWHHADSQLPPEHQAHQGQGQEPSQPYRPESSPVHASVSASASASASSPPLPASVHNPRSNRSYSVAASLASVGSQSSIRRKPLSPTASPLAVRFSSRLNGNHMSLHDLQHPDSGYYSLDSPDLYDLSPNKQEHAPASVPAAALPPGQNIPTPLVEESDEDE